MHIERAVRGYWVIVDGPGGRVTANIFEPEPPRRPDWRVCFAGCTGEHAGLLGKVVDARTLKDCKSMLSSYGPAA